MRHRSATNIGCSTRSRVFFLAIASSFITPFLHAQQPATQTFPPSSWEQAAANSRGCKTCHTTTDSDSMHATGTVALGCTDCHGGDASVAITAGTAKDSTEYKDAKRRAHVQPAHGSDGESFASKPDLYANWLRESQEFIRFVNPGDLRVADQTCGRAGCHTGEVRHSRTSMMSHGAMLWQAALYNNGAYSYKNAHFGESYGPDGKPQRIEAWPPPSADETKRKGILPYLEPLQRWEVSQPGNVLRVFERGGEPRAEIGNPRRDEQAGRPDAKLGDRGFGTQLRTDPVFLGLQKTRLLDPMLYLPGTNDQPGDYRGSGCTGCHVIYANDRDPLHSGEYAAFGNDGRSSSADPTISKNEHGHPIRHVLTKGIPSSQCMVCHVHPGTNMVSSYFGYTFWDNDAEARAMYPAATNTKQAGDPSLEKIQQVQTRNAEGSAPRGLWSDYDFLQKLGTPEFNRQLQSTQFGDYHSHGWVFRAVFKRDRHGNLLDDSGMIVSPDDPERFRKAVQLKDIHLEKGMHCIDCHFEQDVHGNGRLYGETRAAVEITCSDCHGSIRKYATMLTTGPAAPEGGHRLDLLHTPWKEALFYWKDDRLYQRSMVEKDVAWEVVQVKDSVTPGNPHYSEKSALAKTLQRDGKTWGDVHEGVEFAHSDERMTCFACHTSWTTSCFGCHLSMTANQKMPMLHNEGLTTRNYTNYDFMVLRDDVYMLGRDGAVTGNKIAPVRSACAVVVSSQNANRDWLYYGQQTVSAAGFSGQAFSPYVPHTVRARETRGCTDCHVSANRDNNAWMAQVLVQGTNFLNYMGRFAYVATGKRGFTAVAIAEQQEPPAIYGSDLQKIAYPEHFQQHAGKSLELQESYEHPGKEVHAVQLRGEYLYAAMGKGGLRVFDVANIDNKDFSERMITAPVSPLGQRLYVRTKDALDVASPSTLAIDPTRKRLDENEEGPIHPLYGFLYVADKYEGLVVVGDANPKARTPGVSTLLDGEPRNNFLKRALAFNPNRILNGAHRITIAGVYAYILCDAGLVVVDLDNPLAPKVTATLGAPYIKDPTGIAVQFRYAFVTDHDGFKVLDVTHLDKPVPIEGTLVPFTDARNVYVARTYAYVSAGGQGIAIIGVEQPEKPRLGQVFNAAGELNDVNDIKIGMVSSSQFAFVADGRNGFRIVQTFSPVDNREFYGFSPRPTPKLIARLKTKGPALAISKGTDRDRAVDESGNQLAVFGRRGSRPFNLEEMQRLYLRNGELYTVTNDPPGPAVTSSAHQ